jgi:nucleoside phosphorylase
MSKEHGRERVPPAETEEMINSAIAEAATTFGVPAGSIKSATSVSPTGRIAHKNRPNCSAQLAEKV